MKTYFFNSLPSLVWTQGNPRDWTYSNHLWIIMAVFFPPKKHNMKNLRITRWRPACYFRAPVLRRLSRPLRTSSRDNVRVASTNNTVELQSKQMSCRGFAYQVMTKPVISYCKACPRLLLHFVQGLQRHVNAFKINAFMSHLQLISLSISLYK